MIFLLVSVLYFVFDYFNLVLRLALKDESSTNNKKDSFSVWNKFISFYKVLFYWACSVRRQVFDAAMAVDLSIAGQMNEWEHRKRKAIWLFFLLIFRVKIQVSSVWYIFTRILFNSIMSWFFVPKRTCVEGKRIFCRT